METRAFSILENIRCDVPVDINPRVKPQVTTGTANASKNFTAAVTADVQSVPRDVR